MTPGEQAAWDGADRRAQDSLNRFHTILESHTKEEMERYNEIISKIDDNDNASIDRHDEALRKIKHLTDSVDAWMSGNGEFISAIRRAFPRDDEGKPDYDGHRTAHLSWISDAHEQKEFKKFLKNTIIGAVVLGMGGFVLIATWVAFLKGPVH